MTSIEFESPDGLAGLSSVALVELLEAREVQRRRWEFADAQLLAELAERNVAEEFGRTGVVDLLVRRLRVSAAEARRRVARSVDVGPRRELSGAVLEPVLPRVAVAFAAGEISGEHVDVIGRALAELPDQLPDHVPGVSPGRLAEVAEVAEQFLVTAALHEDPRALQRSAVLLAARLNPDGLRPSEELATRRRGVTLMPDPGGGSRVTGRLTVEATAVWNTIVDALGAPQPSTVNGVTVADDRSAAQRRHDAFLDAGLRLIRGGLPDTGGVSTTVLIRVEAQAWDNGSGVAQTGHGQLISLAAVKRIAGADATVIPVLLRHHGKILACGREHRLATALQRRALAARDGGCAFPGCDRPAAWCQANHVQRWEHDGPTDTDNLVLLCGHHHRLLDAGDWDVVMTDGVPHWLPPPWIDPDQQPIRNTTHHLPDIDFGPDDVG